MAPYPQRTIGNDKVSAQGLGCMGMSMAYTSLGGYDDVESLATLSEAADLGITFVCVSSPPQFAKQLLNLGLVGYQ
jgi:aryl-alcohol dehydrogenase-like predicted oxidoreductase